MHNSLIIYRFANEISIISKNYNHNYSKRVIKELENAYKKGLILTYSGQIWLDSDYFHIFIRTNSPETANYFIEGIPDNKKLESEGKTFIISSVALEIIDERIQSASRTKQEYNLRASRDLINTYVDCEAATNQRGLYREKILDEKKLLKSRRIKAYKLIKDELTGEDLIKRSCEFSHVRSVVVYPEFCLNLENGFIVNKETHNLITSKNINNEHELYDLCKEKKWKISWYKDFENRLKNY